MTTDTRQSTQEILTKISGIFSLFYCDQYIKLALEVH